MDLSVAAVAAILAWLMYLLGFVMGAAWAARETQETPTRLPRA